MLLRKKIYQFSLMTLLFACGSLFVVTSVFAQTPIEKPLVVTFYNSEGMESNQLFNAVNFLPGDDAFGYATVSNNSGDPKPIAIEAINFVNDDLDTSGKFGDGLRLIIEEDLNSVECFNGTLTDFFDKGEFLLSDPDLLGNGESITYNFYVIFKENSDNDYQEKSLGFDILIGFQGEGGGVSTDDLPSGLTILDESIVATVSENSATILWTTSYLSTSQVVYAANYESYSFDLSQTNYGYPHATLDYLTKVISHVVEIDNLQANTTYYFRSISHASPPSISRSHSFTTLAMNSNLDGDYYNANMQNLNEDNKDNAISINSPIKNDSKSNSLIASINELVSSVGNSVNSVFGNTKEITKKDTFSVPVQQNIIMGSFEVNSDLYLLFIIISTLAIIIGLYYIKRI